MYTLKNPHTVLEELGGWGGGEGGEAPVLWCVLLSHACVGGVDG